jgi:hypothetical protein
LGFLLSIVGALIGAMIQRKYDKKHERRPLAQLLNFGHDELVFVFPHRDYEQKSILPRTSTEDFMAINNFISALINLEWKGKVSLRHSTNVDDAAKKHNLVVICSTKSNTFTTECQQILKSSGKFFCYSFQDDPSRPNTVLTCSPWDEHCQSPSYKQEQGISPQRLAEQHLDDYAIITKVHNPWNADNILIIVAGIRGIGTWGAAEFLKKKWMMIYDLLPEGKKDSEFSALIQVSYERYDIKDWRVVRVVTQEDFQDASTRKFPPPTLKSA